MDIHNLVIANHHIDLIRALRDYHIRHYIWEVAKVIIPVLITGTITVVVMRGNENRNKKRWLNDGHLKRKTELEIEIRKFLLGIKANTSKGFEVLADWYENQESADNDLILDFNKGFENLYEYLKSEENEDNRYKKIFALMDEYVCYVPKINDLFSDFKIYYEKIFSLKTVYANEDSNSRSNILYGSALEDAKRNPEHFDNMINAYLCFQVVIENILKKLMVKKIIK